MRGFDGPNCEIAIVTQYHNLDMNEIPGKSCSSFLDIKMKHFFKLFI